MKLAACGPKKGRIMRAGWTKPAGKSMALDMARTSAPPSAVGEGSGAAMTAAAAASRMLDLNSDKGWASYRLRLMGWFGVAHVCAT